MEGLTPRPLSSTGHTDPTRRDIPSGVTASDVGDSIAGISHGMEQLSELTPHPQAPQPRRATEQRPTHVTELARPSEAPKPTVTLSESLAPFSPSNIGNQASDTLVNMLTNQFNIWAMPFGAGGLSILSLKIHWTSDNKSIESIDFHVDTHAGTSVKDGKFTLYRNFQTMTQSHELPDRMASLFKPRHSFLSRLTRGAAYTRVTESDWNELFKSLTHTAVSNSQPDSFVAIARDGQSLKIDGTTYKMTTPHEDNNKRDYNDTFIPFERSEGTNSMEFYGTISRQGDIGRIRLFDDEGNSRLLPHPSKVRFYKDGKRRTQILNDIIKFNWLRGPLGFSTSNINRSRIRGTKPRDLAQKLRRAYEALPQHLRDEVFKDMSPTMKRYMVGTFMGVSTNRLSLKAVGELIMRPVAAVWRYAIFSNSKFKTELNETCKRYRDVHSAIEATNLSQLKQFTLTLKDLKSKFKEMMTSEASQQRAFGALLEMESERRTNLTIQAFEALSTRDFEREVEDRIRKLGSDPAANQVERIKAEVYLNPSPELEEANQHLALFSELETEGAGPIQSSTGSTNLEMIKKCRASLQTAHTDLMRSERQLKLVPKMKFILETLIQKHIPASSDLNTTLNLILTTLQTSPITIDDSNVLKSLFSNLLKHESFKELGEDVVEGASKHDMSKDRLIQHLIRSIKAYQREMLSESEIQGTVLSPQISEAFSEVKRQASLTVAELSRHTTPDPESRQSLRILQESLDAFPGLLNRYLANNTAETRLQLLDSYSAIKSQFAKLRGEPTFKSVLTQLVTFKNELATLIGQTSELNHPIEPGLLELDSAPNLRVTSFTTDKGILHFAADTVFSGQARVIMNDTEINIVDVGICKSHTNGTATPTGELFIRYKEGDATRTVFLSKTGQSSKKEFPDFLKALIGNPSEYTRFYRLLTTHYQHRPPMVVGQFVAGFGNNSVPWVVTIPRSISSPIVGSGCWVSLPDIASNSPPS